jgi:hypothetical protein
MSTILNEQRVGPPETDPWLMLLLGLISLAERLEPWLAPAEVHGATTRKPDAALAVLLGVAALKERFTDVIEAVAPAAQPLRATEPGLPTGESLLR